MKSKAGRLLIVLLGVCCLVTSAANESQAPSVSSNVPQDDVSGAVVTRDNASRGIVPVAQGPTTPLSPLPAIPVGYVVVQTNYLEQVSLTANSAINAAKANEEALFGVMKVAGWILAAMVAVCGLFGFKAFADIWATQKKMTATLESSTNSLKEIDSVKNDALPSIREAISQAQDMEAIMINLWFLRIVHQDVKQLLSQGEAGNAAVVASDALADGNNIYALALKHHEDRVKSGTGLSGEDSQVHGAGVDVGVRILSYIAAVMGLLSMRAGVLNDAVEWARRSVQFNPRQFSDRKYNLACILTQRYQRNKKFMDKSEVTRMQCVADRAEVLLLLSNYIGQSELSWRESRTDPDFSEFLKEIDLLKPAQ